MQSSNINVAEQRTRLIFLDLFRFVAALAVVLYHLTYFLPSKPTTFEFFSPFTQYGYLGVNFFFMISGFVIYLSIEKKDWREFIASRVGRLFPAYWFAVLFTATLFFSFPGHLELPLSVNDVLINLTMLQDFLDVTHVDGVYWTLTVELVFYFWMFIFIFFKRLNAIPYFFLVLLCLALLSCFVELPKLLKSILLLDWVSYFLSGIIFYLFYKGNRAPIWFCALIVSLGVSMLKAADYLLYFDVVQRAEFSLLVINSVIVVMYLLFIFLIKYSSYFVKYLNVKLVVFLGGLTYPLYLVHQNASYILFSYFSGDNEFLLLFFLLIASFILSTFIYLIIEKKVHRKLSRFTHSFLNRVSSCKSALIFNTPNLSR
ncbi:acyltransferase family protein [Pseudoalteromonas tunicata]|jgi:peptidoglycan/LPS O-acetylase OafA/YrhL|uniref:Acyltransferase family protein n=1 Tax=Pseudoalteromonas tunicata D2 TaxID=87626 RepID=A4C8J5_9GAMM|nr:acyltransferase [Pseudoalteromonas tunicata]ATC93414.1 hypothetical protein PTUN_a0650 [Pseudoalteromonas tunicata]AXT32456.1 acyltransferase [Pseudoalteromonas tunicata]EAR28910.1 acyltransferase family protein [Pseudoalteromonas tunicata D2]